jgi:hypothetical protein
VFIDSQNSPCDVVPSPVETKTTSSHLNPSVMPRALARTTASADPTACRNCVPVGDELRDDVELLVPQCDGICRPPELGSIAAPTAE